MVTVTIVHESSPLVISPLVPLDRWAKRVSRAAQDIPLDGGFAHRMFALSARMREAKAQRSRAPFYEALPFGRRCDRCGKRMAAHQDPVEPKKLLCSVCERRDSKGRQQGKDIRGRFNREFGERPEISSCRARQPEDLDTLVESAKRKYLAFLYADGNDIGRLLWKAKHPCQYTNLSKALEDGTQEALFGALVEVCGAALQKENRWPFDIINMGGDDVTLVLQAGYAWEVGVRFLERFEKEMRTRLPGASEEPLEVTASCGIAIADVRYPMRYFERLASDLLKEAKRWAKREQGKPRSAITFLWLPSPVAGEKAEPLMGFYTRPSAGDWHRKLTARPYDLEHAQKLLDASRAMRKWPRALRHRWAEALERGVMSSVNLIYYDIARRSEEKRAKMYEALVQVGKLASSDEEHAGFPAPVWYPVHEDREPFWRTALVDALELAELEATRCKLRLNSGKAGMRNPLGGMLCKEANR